MIVYKCKMCGGSLEIQEGMTVCECEYCGSKQTVPNLDDEKKINLFTRANRLRSACEFDKASGVYESLLSDFPEEAEAYWGLLLCKFGVEYVDDPKTGKKIPTCHRSSFDSIFDDQDFEMVMEYSDPGSRSVYRDEAKTIEELRIRINEVSSKEAPYDIFICYKETDTMGQRTIDSVIAQDVYDALTEKGYRVFFSRISLEDKLGQEYEPYIFAALNSAKVMLAFGTDYEYYNAVWVKNEWSRFLGLIEKGEKKTLIPCYKGIDAYDMPKEFARLQAQDMGKVGAIQDLLRGIEKVIGKNGQNVANTTVSGNEGALTKRGYLYLEDKDYSKAVEYFEKALDENPEDGSAYLGAILTKFRIQSLDELEALPIALDSVPYYVKAVRFSSGAQQARLQSILEDNKKKVANNRELAENVVHGGIKKLISLAPILVTAVEHLKASEYEEILGVSKIEIDKALVAYEVFRVLEVGGTPMNSDDIISASDKLRDDDIKEVRKSLVDLNNAGYISFEDHKFSIVSASFKAEKEKENREKGEFEISKLQQEIDRIDARIPELNEQISQAKSKKDVLDSDIAAIAIEAERKAQSEIEEKREQILAIQTDLQQLNMNKNGVQQGYDSVKSRHDSLLEKKNILEREKKSLSLFQGKKKKEIQAEITGIDNQILSVEAELRTQESRLSDVDNRINSAIGSIKSIENAIAAIEKKRTEGIENAALREIKSAIAQMETEHKSIFDKKSELEARISSIRESISSYEWKPDSIAENFNDGSYAGDEIYEFIMKHYYNPIQKVQAIKYHREQTGLGLPESKAIVEEMFAGTYVPKATKSSSATISTGSSVSLDDYIRTHFNKNTKVQAIKYYREQTGLGLKEAKDAVERLI